MGIEKRKSSVDEEEEDQRAKNRRRKKKEADLQAVVVPTEDEVEEFFAIVRRMQVAVKYFEKSAGAGKGRRVAEEGVGAATEVDAVNSNGETDCGDRLGSAIATEERKERNGGLDLNAEPEMDDQDRR